jgi:hypothetical protein
MAPPSSVAQSHVRLREALEALKAEKSMFKEHLSSNIDDEKLEKDARAAFARAKTTKAECLILKALMSTTKTPEAMVESITKHKTNLNRATKQDADKLLFVGIVKEASRFFKK